MTDQHPLTDDLCHTVCEDWPPEDDVEKDNMRSAADWQLQQVTKWLHDNLGNEIYADACQEDYDNLRGYIITDSVIDDLKQAMRPRRRSGKQSNNN
jgi:hypothetical protein